MNERSCSDHAVFNRHRETGGAEIGKQLRPAQAGSGVPREAYHAGDPVREPVCKPATPIARWQQENAKHDLAKDNRIQGKLAFMVTQPLHKGAWMHDKVLSSAAQVRNRPPGFIARRPS